MHALKKITLSITVAIMMAVALSACSLEDTSQDKESTSRQSAYDILVANQPGETMTYSPTRETINFWVKTWNEPGKLSYVYLQNSGGQITGYYVFEGLPVSYCAAISPTYEVDSNSNGKVLVPQPANDGVYYSGGQCNTYYGKDAESGSYIEYTAGLGINILLYDQPLPGSIAGDAVNLGPRG